MVARSSVRALGVGLVAALLFVGILPSASALAVPGAAEQGLRTSALAIFDTTGPVLGDTSLGPVSPTRTVDLTVGLAYPDPGALAAYLQAVNDPRSPDFRHFLTEPEFVQRFSPSVSSVGTVTSYFEAHGASHVTVSSDHLVVTLTLPASQVPTVFGSSLEWYTDAAAGRYINVAASPQLPSALSSLVAGVDGLDTRSNGLESRAIASHLEQVAASKAGLADFDDVSGSPLQIFYGTDYRAAYGALPLIQAGDDGSGLAVATLLTSGWNASVGADGENLPPWDPAALALYYQVSFPQGSAIPSPVGVPVDIGGVTPPQPGTAPSNAQNDDSGSVAENSLDLEMVGSLAPAASIYNFYFAGNLTATSLSSAAGDFDSDLEAALGYDYGTSKLVAISNSWGLADTNDTTWDELEAEAAATGVTILAASGDQGDLPPADTDHPQGQWPGFPATATFDDYGTIAVGGTELNVSGTATGTWNPNGDFAPPTGYDADNITGVSGQTVWYQYDGNPSDDAGSEGGISTTINEPRWQAESQAQAAIKAAALVEGVGYARAIPDVASIADQTIVYVSYEPSQQLVGVGVYGGTSVSTPVVAALLADVIGAMGLGEGLGFLDPELYAIGGYFQAHPGNGEPYLDVTSGGNAVFRAAAGWDPVTGWGTPVADLLAPALENATIISYVYNASAIPGKATGPPVAPPTSFLPLLELLIAVVIVLVAVVVLAVVVVTESRRRRLRNPPRAQPVAPAYAPPMGYGSPPWGVPAPPSPYGPPPPPYGTTPGYGGYAPTYPSYYPGTSTYGPYYAPPAPAPWYGPSPPSPPPPPPTTCRFCHSTLPPGSAPCTLCGTPR